MRVPRATSRVRAGAPESTQVSLSPPEPSRAPRRARQSGQPSACATTARRSSALAVPSITACRLSASGQATGASILASVTVDEPRAADLALARSCARGEPAAIAAFEATYFGEIDAAAQVARAGSGIAGEARQVLRRVLFVNEPGRTAAVAG